MCSECVTKKFGVVAGSAAGLVGALLLSRRWNSAKPMAEPPSPTFQEWIAAIVAKEEEEEDLRVSTVRGSEWVSVPTSGGAQTPVPYRERY